MNVIGAICGLVALLSGIRALGYLAILQVGGVRAADGPGVALTMYVSVLLFVTSTAVSAYVAQRKGGARAIFLKFLFLTGAYGLPVIALFTVASRGAVLRMPEIVGLLLVFGCFVLFLRTSVAKRRTPPVSA